MCAPHVPLPSEETRVASHYFRVELNSVFSSAPFSRVARPSRLQNACVYFSFDVCVRVHVYQLECLLCMWSRNQPRPRPSTLPSVLIIGEIPVFALGVHVIEKVILDPEIAKCACTRTCTLHA